MTPPQPRKVRQCPDGASCLPGDDANDPLANEGALPTCSTGPFGRAAWVLKEIIEIFRGRA